MGCPHGCIMCPQRRTRSCADVRLILSLMSVSWLSISPSHHLNCCFFSRSSDDVHNLTIDCRSAIDSFQRIRLLIRQFWCRSSRVAMDLSFLIHLEVVQTMCDSPQQPLLFVAFKWMMFVFFLLQLCIAIMDIHNCFSLFL